jgi:hypothetical protein
MGVFVRHMEERFTWENVIAGVSTGTVVPVQWRGCLRGCLAFLDDSAAAMNPDDAGMDIDGPEDGDMDESAVVRAVSLAPLGLGDAFEDDA